MPGRVNTRFVLILVTTITAVVMVLFAVWYFKIRSNPVQLARKGDVYMQEGEYARAIEAYGSAARRDPTEIAYLDKFIDAINIAPAENNTVAETRMGLLLRAYQQRSDAVADDKLLDEYYQKLLELARSLGYPGLYQQLFNVTKVRLDARPDDLLAHKFRGIARVHLLTGQGDDFDQPYADQQQAHDDLLMVLDRNPDDTQARYHLALWTLFDARYTRHTNGSQDEIQRRRAEAISLSQSMLEVDPSDPQLMLQHARILLQAIDDMQTDSKPQTEEIEQLRQQADQLLTKVETDLLADPQPVDRVLEAAGLVQQSDLEEAPQPDSGNFTTTRGTLRAARLMAAGLEKQPDNIDFLVRSGILLAQMGQIEQARAALEEARRPGRQQPAIAALRTRNQQLLATLRLGDLLITQRSSSTDPAQIADLEKRVTDLIKEVETSYGRLPALDQLEGKMQLAQGHYAVAQQLLNKAATQSGQSDLDSMRMAAMADLQSGDWGAAAEKLELILARVPDVDVIRRQLVGVYLRGGKVQEAQAHLDVLLAKDKDNIDNQLLLANLLAAQEKVDEAIALYESLNTVDNVYVDTNLARLYVIQGRKDDAQQLLLRRYDKDHSNVLVLQALLPLTEDKGVQQQYLEQYRQAGGSEELIALIQRQLEDQPLSPEETSQMMLNLEKDPFNNAVIRARLMAQQGNLEGADKALTEAAALKPDDQGVLELRFNLALQREQWDQADRLVERASSLNADLSGGAFFAARLAEARGQLDKAVTQYEEALAKRPVFSEGWTRLGDARWRLNRTQAALEAYQRALAQQPNNIAALSNISRLEAQMGLSDSALQHARAAWMGRQNNAQLREIYLQLEQQYGDPKVALEIRQEIARNQPADADNQRALAVLLATMGENQQALAKIDQLIELEGNNANNALTKALLLLDMDRGDQGEQVLTDYNLSLGDKLGGDDLVRLAQYRLRRGNVESALAAYQQARDYDDADQRYTRLLSDTLFELGLIDQAVTMYRQLHKQDPNDTMVTLRLCETLLRSGQREEAAGLLKGLEVPDPQKSTLYLLQAALVGPGGDQPLDRQQRAEALRWLNMAIQADPNNAPAYVRRAVLLIDQPDSRAAAINDLNRGLEINPRLTDARRVLVRLHLQNNDIDEAVRELRQMLQQNPRDRESRLTLINIYRSRNQAEQANRLIDEAMELTPNDPTWPALKARIAVNAGQINAALPYMQKLVEIEANSDSISQYATALLSVGRTKDALDLLRQYAVQVNQNIQLQAVRARALHLSGQKDEARRLFSSLLHEAQKVDDFDAIINQVIASYGPEQTSAFLAEVQDLREPIWLELAQNNLLMAQRQWEQLIPNLEAMRPRLPQDQQIQHKYLTLLALSYHQTERYEQARAAYDELVKIAPQDVSALNNLAYLLIEQFDDREQALVYAQQAVAAAPDNASVLDTLGLIQYKSGQLEQARRTLETSLLRQPLAPTCVHLGQVYADLGLTSLAFEQLNRAKELADVNQEPQYRREAEQLLEKLSQPAQ
ncbi:MAG: tetratricopeptide repeat protein [Phycisphaeraceae bacterium]|nr:tetratricopeptide repeat protein [Phycisphaeraceae bacterium]